MSEFLCFVTGRPHWKQPVNVRQRFRLQSIILPNSTMLYVYVQNSQNFSFKWQHKGTGVTHLDHRCSGQVIFSISNISTLEYQLKVQKYTALTLYVCVLSQRYFSTKIFSDLQDACAGNVWLTQKYLQYILLSSSRLALSLSLCDSTFCVNLNHH